MHFQKTVRSLKLPVLDMFSALTVSPLFLLFSLSFQIKAYPLLKVCGWIHTSSLVIGMMISCCYIGTEKKG